MVKWCTSCNLFCIFESANILSPEPNEQGSNLLTAIYLQHGEGIKVNSQCQKSFDENWDESKTLIWVASANLEVGYLYTSQMFCFRMQCI
jgi:hypothetical protein